MPRGRKTPWTVEEEDLDRLRSLYIRTSLGTGYYHVRNGRELVTIGKPGYAGTDAALEEEIRSRYLAGFPRVEIKGHAVFRTDLPTELHVTAQIPGKGQIIASAKGAAVQKATGSPLLRSCVRPSNIVRIYGIVRNCFPDNIAVYRGIARITIMHILLRYLRITKIYITVFHISGDIDLRIYCRSVMQFNTVIIAIVGRYRCSGTRA